MGFDGKFDIKHPKLKPIYEEAWEIVKNMAEDRRTHFNIIMIEAECGYPFVDRLRENFPEIFDDYQHPMFKTS